MEANNPLSGTGARGRIAAAVRVELALARMSAAELARQIGVAQSTFNRRMTGEVSFSAEEIAAIAAALGVDPATLLADAAPKAPATAGAA